MARQEEKHITIALADPSLVLDGIFVRGGDPDAEGAVIAPPHPLYGGSMDSPVVNEVAYACKRAGYASVRFNWRGVGASSGSPSGETGDADADYAAALAYLGETVAGPLLACGYSFGACAAVRVATRSPRVRRLLLVSPPPSLLDAAALEQFRGSALLLTGERDELAPPDRLRELASRHPRARLETVPEADHFYGAGLADVGRTAAAWLGAGPSAG